MTDHTQISATAHKHNGTNSSEDLQNEKCRWTAHPGAPRLFLLLPHSCCGAGKLRYWHETPHCPRLVLPILKTTAIQFCSCSAVKLIPSLEIFLPPSKGSRENPADKGLLWKHSTSPKWDNWFIHIQLLPEKFNRHLYTCEQSLRPKTQVTEECKRLSAGEHWEKPSEESKIRNILGDKEGAM